MNTQRPSVLVTGTSSGMGKACALRLSRGGYRVFASVRKERDAGMLKREGAEGLVPIILDVTDAGTISRAQGTVRDAVGQRGLQGLVNNAGTGFTAPIEVMPLDDLRRIYEVNVIGQIAVIQAFLPLIRAGGGRIVNVGSVGGKVAVPYGSAISSTKSAFESLNDSLRMELRPWRIPVILVAPGSIHTPAVEKLAGDTGAMVERFAPEGRERYEAAYRAFVATFVKMEQEGVGPEVMADTVFRALTARRPRRRYPVGPKSRLLPFMGTYLPASLLDAIRARLFGIGRADEPRAGAHPAERAGEAPSRPS